MHTFLEILQRTLQYFIFCLELILNAYVDEITKNYFSISVSIKRTIKKLTISSYL